MTTSFNRVLDSRPDPLDVLKSTRRVVEHARKVKIDSDAIKRTADQLAEQRVQPPAWNYEYHYHDATEHTVNYLFLLDTLNFSFWGKPKWAIDYSGKRLDGYWALAASLKRAAESSLQTLDAEYLAQISPQELQAILRGHGEIPLFLERWRNVRALGVALRDHWRGQAVRLIDEARRDAPALARLIAESIPSFDDIAVYDGREVRLFKRAQILVTDVWGAFGGGNWGEFANIGDLTAFADYKLPQILRAWGVLRYAPALARQVDAQIELAAGGPNEVEIRSATLWAVELLREELGARGRKLWSVQVDWILWQASQGRFAGMKPYHRVRTIYY
ncbi:MAG: queuosine salvage family protein [Chloroflexi bacterium]|nr:queuosine salvage family protein [Chloroflexota bacterium]